MPSTPQQARVLLALGGVAIVLGGLVAAVTGPFGWTKGSWAAAFLVLVVGVAQYAMGWMRADVADDRSGWVQVAGWNIGGALVVLGTLVETPLLVDLGSLLLVVALAHALRADLRPRPAAAARPRAMVVGYRLLLLVMLVSIPIGITLSHLRN